MSKKTKEDRVRWRKAMSKASSTHSPAHTTAAYAVHNVLNTGFKVYRQHLLSDGGHQTLEMVNVHLTQLKWKVKEAWLNS